MPNENVRHPDRRFTRAELAQYNGQNGKPAMWPLIILFMTSLLYSCKGNTLLIRPVRI
ncbi:MAG: hypothetical protein ACM3YE_06355 [Bacteroidota bacterium]